MLKQANNAVHQTIGDEWGSQSINRGYNSVFRPNLSLKSLEEIGVNHVALNLRLNQADT